MRCLRRVAPSTATRRRSMTALARSPLLLLQLLAWSVGATTINVTFPAAPAAVNPLIMGCHSDSGFGMQPFGFESQMIVGASFEANRSKFVPLDRGDTGNPLNVSWNHQHDGAATIGLDQANPFHGRASMGIALDSGTFAAVTNRGMGNEGLVLLAGKEYTGYVFARAEWPPVKLTVALHDITDRAAPRQLLAAAELRVGSSTWAKYDFKLTPNGSTGCVFIPFGSDPDIQCYDGAVGNLTPGPLPVPMGAGHACQRCGGEISFGLTEPGAAVFLDSAALHPGDWGRYAGLEVRRDAVEALKFMGVTAIRLGGSFTDAAYYYWKNWRGRKWERQSFGECSPAAPRAHKRLTIANPLCPCPSFGVASR